MSRLGRMSQREAVTPIGLPTKVTHRIRLKLLATNHPVLMRYIEEIDDSMLGPAIASFAEDGIRARLGMGPSDAGSVFIHSKNDAPIGTSGESATESSAGLSDMQPPQINSTAKYDKDAISEIFPQYGGDDEL